MSMEPVITQYDGPIHPLIKWAVNRHGDPPEPFLSWVTDLMPETHRKGMGYWVGCTTHDSPLDGEWHKGYPHCHVKAVDWLPDTITITTCLTVAEAGGEFGLGGVKETDPYKFIALKPGLTVMLDAIRWHGVRPVIKGTRISLMITALPD